MKFNIATNILPFSRRNSSLLVCETDGFSLRAVVLTRTGDTLTASFSALSRAQDFKNAVTEVVNKLKDQGWKGRDKAILLMPGVISALVELPVSPSKPRAALEMQELVRYELEPLLMQHTTIWSVGRILVGLGYLEEAQAREVLARQQGKFHSKEPSNKMEMYSLKRFGDVAIEHHYITREQLDEALAKQAWLRMEGDEIACGWQAIKTDTDAQSPYPWLVSGVNKGLLKQWEDAFSAQRISLTHLFPAAGCAAANVNAGEQAIVLEVGGGQVLGIRLGEQGIASLVAHESALNGVMEACLETYHGLTPPDPQLITLAVHDIGDDAFIHTLSEVIGRELVLLPTNVSGSAELVSPGMAGAARHIFHFSGAHHCCAVPTAGPKARLSSLPQFPIVAGSAMIILAIALSEVVLQVRQSIAAQEAEKVAQEAEKFDAAMAEVGALIKQQDDIKAKRDEAKKAEQRADFYTNELPRRAAMVRSLLDNLERTTNDQVVLDQVAEEPKRGVIVSAWALSDTAAQQFALAFGHALESLGLAMVDVRVTEKNGRLSLPGYGVTFRIVDKATAAALASASNGVKK